MAKLFDALNVESPEALAAIASPENGRWYFVPGTDSRSPALYCYRAGDSRAENPPQILSHPVGGRFERSGGGGTWPTQIRAGTLAPTGTPPTVDPQSDGKTDLYLQVTITDYGTLDDVRLYVGVDKTGVMGTNGWAYFYDWST